MSGSVTKKASPKPATRYVRVALIALLLVLVGCGSGDAGSSTTTADESDPTGDTGTGTDIRTGSDEATRTNVNEKDPRPVETANSESEEPDYSDDAGVDLENHEYPDDPEPAAEISATLCNLNQEYFTSLRAESGAGVPVVDETLRLAVLSISDKLSLWESIRSHHTEFDQAIDAARSVRDHWNTAVFNQENGEEQVATEAMLDAEAEIMNLPMAGDIEEVEC